MAIIQFPNHTSASELLPCTLCSLAILPSKATIGMLDAHDCQMFACHSHFWDKAWFFVDGWIAFATQERMKLLAIQRRRSEVNTYQWEGDSNAGFIY